MKIEVCILAGGKSRRMGSPKAALLLDGSPLLHWAQRIARAAGFSYRTVDQDLEESVGPISGIRTALKTSRADAIIFLPCDMPFVRASSLRRLAEVGGAVFSESAGLVGFPFLLPKHVEVTADSLQSLARKLAAKRMRIDEEEAFNINTPADFKEAARRLTRDKERTLLDVDSLSIRRGEVEILRDINWRVLKGDHWAMLGANGSGKTSLLSALTGYLSATTGSIRLLGREFGRADWRALRKEVGLVSSSVRQLMADAETALETVVSGKDASIDRWGTLTRADRERGRAILAQVGCGALEKRVWAVLSQGERQRVLIGRALMAAPKVLILDEPCAGLDPAAREHFLDFLQRMTEQRAAPGLILVTHHVEEIVPGLTHVLALKGGRVAAAGAKRATLTSALLGQIFDCRARLKAHRGRFELRVLSQREGVM